MSGWTEIGSLDAIDGSALAVATTGERFRLSFSSPGGRKAVIDLSAEAWDQFLELAARAAMPVQRAAAAAERMAIDGHGNLRPVSEFTRGAEKWWCDGEDCDGPGGPDLDVPHVHPMYGPALPVDLLTGRTAEAHAGAAARTTAGEAG